MTEVMSDFRQMLKKKKKKEEEEEDLEFAPIDRRALRVAPVIIGTLDVLHVLHLGHRVP